MSKRKIYAMIVPGFFFSLILASLHLIPITVAYSYIVHKVHNTQFFDADVKKVSPKNLRREEFRFIEKYKAIN